MVLAGFRHRPEKEGDIMPMGLSLQELETLIWGRIETEMGQMQAMKHGENPIMADSFLKQSMEAPASDSEKELRVFVGVVVTAVTAAIDANNKTIETYLLRRRKPTV